MDFDEYFKALTGYSPFPWQGQLFKRFMQGEIPSSCDLPTGLGKTSIMAIWLIALAKEAKVPRRLVYVVNRRTVVDQATREAERLRENLERAGLTAAPFGANSPTTASGARIRHGPQSSAAPSI